MVTMATTSYHGVDRRLPIPFRLYMQEGRLHHTALPARRALFERPGKDEARHLGAVGHATDGLDAGDGRLAGSDGLADGGEEPGAFLAGEGGERGGFLGVADSMSVISIATGSGVPPRPPCHPCPPGTTIAETPPPARARPSLARRPSSPAHRWTSSPPMSPPGRNRSPAPRRRSRLQ